MPSLDDFIPDLNGKIRSLALGSLCVGIGVLLGTWIAQC